MPTTVNAIGTRYVGKGKRATRRAIMSLVPNRNTMIALALSACCWAVPALAGAEDAKLPNPFFAYCVGIGVSSEAATLPAQLKLAPMLAELGYSGMAYVGLGGALDMLQALEKHGQKLFAVYIPLNVDPGAQGYDPQAQGVDPQAGRARHRRLAGGQQPEVQAVVQQRRRRARRGAVAADRRHGPAPGVALSLYPHLGCYAERMEDVVRLAKKTDRPNVGVTFTFCHFLAVDDRQEHGPRAGDGPALSEHGHHQRHRRVQAEELRRPLDSAPWTKGASTTSAVLVTLRKLDYHGPIGMIAYGIAGDPHDVLARSIKGWRAIWAKAVAAAARSPERK